VTSVAAGDTARWIIGDTSSGSGPARSVHILVKPVASDLSTNLVIATDRRTYHLQLESTRGNAMTAIQWSYPQGALIALEGHRAPASAPQPAESGVALEGLDFDYAIDGDTPSWRPLRAFNDGRQTYIEFPRGIAAGEVAPLFAIGANGEAELVNYRQRGRYYIVDRVLEAAELRLGAQHQQIVRIRHRASDPAHPRRGGRS
jgi:type IV secretion system protein VirB9